MVNSLWRQGANIIAATQEDHASNEDIYVKCQWQRVDGVNILYLCYRWLVTVFTISVALASFLLPERGTRSLEHDTVYWKWFIYLTNWGYTLVVGHTVLSLIFLQTAFIEQRAQSNGDSSSFTDVELNLCNTKENLTSKFNDNTLNRSRSQSSSERRLRFVYRILHAAATDLSFLITTVYWSMVYDPEIHVIDAMNVLVHGCNSGIMMLELWVVSHVARPLDVLAPITVAGLYTTFSIVYHAAGGQDRAGRPFIYPGLNWSHPARAVVFCVGCTIGILVAHVLMMLLQTARRAGYRRISNERTIYLHTRCPSIGCGHINNY